MIVLSASIVEIQFPKLNHFWMYAGLLGLYRIAQKEQSNESGVEITFDDTGVSFKGSEKNVQSFLQKTYNRLLKDYYNTSSQTQIEKKEGFYYDTKKESIRPVSQSKIHGNCRVNFQQGPASHKWGNQI